MPKLPLPFFRAKRNRWCVQLAGKQINLGPDEAEAYRRYHRLMADRGTAPKPTTASTSPPDGRLVCEVLDAYLAWCESNRSPRTYAGHRWHLQRFLSALPDAATLTVAALTPDHLEGWANRKAGGKHVWGPTYRRNAIGSVKCAFAWAVEKRVVAASPVASVRRPEAARTRRAVTPAEFERLLAAAKHPRHRDALVLLWETGMRPHELRILEARHVDLAGRRILIPKEEAKGRKADRLIVLTDAALKVVQRSLAANPVKELLVNARHRPWTCFALNNLFQRLCQEVGFHASPYLFRHGFATRLLKANASVATVAALMGHTDPTMVLKVYQHVGDDLDHLRAALSRAAGV